MAGTSPAMTVNIEPFSRSFRDPGFGALHPKMTSLSRRHFLVLPESFTASNFSNSTL
jgi:hypothetical protein